MGLSCDFGLHIAEAYNQSPYNNRKDRTTDCISRMGSAICSAAFTTVLGVIPMVFCTLQIFVKFGIIIPTSMLLSVFFGLHFFTPLLMFCGPEVHESKDLQPETIQGKLRIVRAFLLGTTGRRLLTGTLLGLIIMLAIEEVRTLLPSFVGFDYGKFTIRPCPQSIVLTTEQSIPAYLLDCDGIVWLFYFWRNHLFILNTEVCWRSTSNLMFKVSSKSTFRRQAV